MQPTTLVLRNIIRNELIKHNIKPIHTYTEYKRIFSMPWKHDKHLRYVSYQFPDTYIAILQEIVDECNRVLPEGKFRVTSTPNYKRAEDAPPPSPNYSYIRATGIIAKYFNSQGWL